MWPYVVSIEDPESSPQALSFENFGAYFGVAMDNLERIVVSNNAGSVVVRRLIGASAVSQRISPDGRFVVRQRIWNKKAVWIACFVGCDGQYPAHRYQQERGEAAYRPVEEAVVTASGDNQCLTNTQGQYARQLPLYISGMQTLILVPPDTTELLDAISQVDIQAGENFIAQPQFINTHFSDAAL